MAVCIWLIMLLKKRTASMYCNFLLTNLQFKKYLSSGLCLHWPSLSPTWIPVFDPSSLSAPLFSLFSRGLGSSTGLSLSSSTTPREETILLSSFCISHSKYNLYFYILEVETTPRITWKLRRCKEFLNKKAHRKVLLKHVSVYPSWYSEIGM